MKSSGSLIKFKLHKTTGWSEFADIKFLVSKHSLNIKGNRSFWSKHLRVKQLELCHESITSFSVVSVLLRRPDVIVITGLSLSSSIRLSMIWSQILLVISPAPAHHHYQLFLPQIRQHYPGTCCKIINIVVLVCLDCVEWSVWWGYQD